VKEFLDKQFGVAAFQKIWTQIKIIAKNTLNAIHDLILTDFHKFEAEVSKKLRYFQLFGFDILVDSDFKCWLLEVCITARC
jgi:hypothetical protein